jgi:uncharacterized protein (TIGR02147 family)
MKHLFEYLNYRDFLRDYYTDKKAQHSFYSYRLFSEKAGFRSPNFLKLVIDGKRNLSKESVFKFRRALKLNKRESEYFENLVFFNQSASLEEKNTYLGALMKYRQKADPSRIEKSEYAYYSHWYHPVIRELATARDFGEDYRRLGQAVIPAIGGEEARKSVRLLLDLGFIRQTKDGQLEKTALSLTTGRQVRSVAVANYHKAMLGLAAESIERFESQERDLEALTLRVSDETYRTMMSKAHGFLMELLKIAESDPGAERVIQVGLQLFPLSQRQGPGKGERS